MIQDLKFYYNSAKPRELNNAIGDDTPCTSILVNTNIPDEFRPEILQFHLPHTSNQCLVPWIAKRHMKFTLDSNLNI
jgi:hypothetical protein